MAEIASLPLFHQIAGKGVLVLGNGEAADPKLRLVERAGGIVTEDQAKAIEAGIRLAFVALDDGEACETAAAELRAAGMLVNVVDRPDLCDFTTPSLLDRHPLLIAIGTGGASAGLAKHVRLRLERVLPQTLGKLAEALKGMRPALRARFPDGAERRRAIDEALREGGTLDPLNPASHEKVARWAKGSFDASGSETHVFELASDDPEDLTVRQARLLGEADAVCAQGPVPAAVLSRARADAARLECPNTDCPLRTIGQAGLSQAPCPQVAATLESARLTVVLRSPRSG